jgi:peptide/nickel transport system substrate-binding protein
MTAQDVVFSLERVRTNDPRFQSRLLFSSIDKIEAVDANTVRVTTKRPDVTTLGNLAATGAAILAPQVLERWERLTSAEHAIGTGAFVLQTLDDNHSSVTRNPDYWKPGLPYLDGIHNQYFSDDAGAYASYLGGTIDLVANPVSGPDAKKLFDEQQSKDFVAEWFKDISWTSVQANTQRKPFDDARVGRAVKLLIDHDEASNEWAVTWFGRGYITSFLPAGLDEWDFTEEEYRSKYLEYKRPKDEAVREAIRLLNAAGFTRENPLRFATSGISGSFSGNMVELHQAQINRLGQGVVQVTDIRLQELAILNNVLARGDFEYSVSNLVPPQPYDVDSWFTTVIYTGGGRNYGKFSDPQVDQMVDRQRTIFDVAQRKTQVKEILNRLIENSPYTGWSGRYVLNIGRRRVKDWAPEGASAKWGYNYEKVWLDT